MSELTTFRDHCRKMAGDGAHDPGCPSLRPRISRWAAELLGIQPFTPPPCDGCISPQDRALFAHLADEIDAYLAGGDDEPLADWTELSGGVE